MGHVADAERDCDPSSGQLQKEKTKCYDQDLGEGIIRSMDTEQINFRPYGENGEDLFAYMSQDMLHLMARYGKDCLLLDATHKTTKYEVPLFQLVTNTNCGYQNFMQHTAFVAIFFVETESSQSIAETLQIIKRWGAPSKMIFVIDHSLPQLNALAQVIPGCCIHSGPISY
ncbi:hypothetical protein CAPTEDRAFT_186230 [Capitella teleta]|uniref:ZSWIM1/3 RNaseH-like domain-containing protein n=1 Tax=Capitella teleta TaxID=283909 RepID=R7U4Q4_CAPTE|nr:hypothetical protein CAPTEDRAFT_186230 [Capitella teleta]|eukprot:ELT98676.1 hypothetical protein CAPTEDRAFT_186230 [Capitella teleta]